MKSSFNIRFLAITASLLATVVASRAAEDITSSTNALTLSTNVSMSSSSEKHYLPWEKGSVALGGFIATFHSSVSIGINGDTGFKIDGEQALGLDSSLTVFRASATYRPGKSLRHQLDFDYASYDRTGEATLSQDLTIDGITYPVGAHVTTVLDFDIIRGDYSYAILQDERMRIALGAGIYVVPLKYGLNIDTTGGRSAVEGANTTLPLPALALRTEFQLIPRLFLNGAIDGMYLEVDDFRGSLIDATVAVEYRPWNHFGVGAGWSYLAVNVSSEKTNSDYPGDNFVGSVDVHFSGVLLYGKFSF